MKFEYPPPGYIDRASWWFAGYVCGLLFAAAVAIVGGGCSKPAPRVPGVLPVAVVAWPSPIKPKCEVADVPPVPDVFLWKKMTEEESGRVYVTERQLADLVVWNHDMTTWAGTVTHCLRLMTEAP